MPSPPVTVAKWEHFHLQTPGLCAGWGLSALASASSSGPGHQELWLLMAEDKLSW